MSVSLIDCPANDLEIFQRAFDCFLKYLLTSQERTRLGIRVEFHAPSDELKGGKVWQVKKKKFTVQIATLPEIDKQLFALAHEIAHIRQMLRGELVSNETGVFWNGERIENTQAEPHETEANNFARAALNYLLFGTK